MSAFSAVDSSPDPARLIAYLGQVGLTGMRQYMAATHARSERTRLLLDLGCGAGHDLAAFLSSGIAAVGVDPSARMLDAAAGRVGVPLVQANGECLPFGDHLLSGCSMQRVLMHVADPAAVIAEVVRCVEPGGVLTIFEPDWSTLATNGSAVPVAWL